MQVVITLNTEEEMITFFEKMKFFSAKAKQTEPKAEQKAEKTSTPIMPEPAAAAPVSAPAPSPAKTVTRQEVQAKAIAQMDAGKQAQLQALLLKYNVPALPSIPEDQLAAFYADLEVL